MVDLDDQGERTFTFMVRPSADLFTAKEDLPHFAANQWLHVCSIALSAEPSRSTTFAAMEKIKLAGGRVSFDPNIRPDLWQDQELLHACLDRALRMANVVKLSEEELVFISGSDDLAQGIASITARYQPELLLVTQAKRACLPPSSSSLPISAPSLWSAWTPPARVTLCRRTARKPCRQRDADGYRRAGTHPDASANLRRSGDNGERRDDRSAIPARS